MSRLGLFVHSEDDRTVLRLYLRGPGRYTVTGQFSQS